MPRSGPPIISLETDSAWVVILTVSLVTVPAVFLARRLLKRPGGVASGVLLALPLVLPIVAAFVLDGNGGLPEVAVLRPVATALIERPSELMQYVWITDGRSDLGMAYVITAAAGLWMFAAGVLVSFVMLARRAAGGLLMRRLLRRCEGVGETDGHAWLLGCVEGLAKQAGLRAPPQLLLLPKGVCGAFAVGLRRRRVLISSDLIEDLDPDEVEGILAHEIAHLRARDVELVFFAGLLRDVMAWNPLAHVAFRRLGADREQEADRCAAAITGNPLSLASGLLKVCERVDRRPGRAQRAAMAAMGSTGALTHRVRSLIALSDAGVPMRDGGRLPYLAAALVIALLGFQAAASIASERSISYALVWGTPTVSDAQVWAPGADAHGAGRSSGVAKKSRSARKTAADRPERFLGHPERYLSAVSGMALRERDVDRWMTAVMKVARKTGIPVSTLQWQGSGWRAEPMFSSPGLGPVSILRIELRTAAPQGPR